MKVYELIAKLQSLPHQADVEYLYDLGCNEPIDHVWLARNGVVYVTDSHQWFSNENYWPPGVIANVKNPFSDQLEDWSPDPNLL